MVRLKEKNFEEGNMVKVIGLDPRLTDTIKRALELGLKEEESILCIDINAIKYNEAEVLESINKGVPVVVFGFDPHRKVCCCGREYYPILRSVVYLQLPVNKFDDVVGVLLQK